MGFRTSEDFKPFYSSFKMPSIPKKRKQKVIKRDGDKCVACGSTKDLTVDHIIPYSKGGSNAQSNLQAMCYTCNQEKGDKIN